MEPYYYQKMNKPQQAAYHAMQQGVLALADEIQLPRIPAEELYDVFFRLRLDHPEIFWVVSYRYRYYQDSPNIIFVPEYLFEKNKIREHQKAMQSRVEKLARSAAKFTEWEKEKYIHDFICENITYDKLKKPYSHEIIGPLGQGVGVCEGIAKSVKVLCDALGVWCVIAICGNNPEKGIKYRHTWNIVRIGGQYYHLDATFDNTLRKHQGNAEAPGEIRYDYFNLGDSIWGKYGFYDAFSEGENWYPHRYLAIDQCTITPMIENYRTGLLWRLFMSCPEIQDGLKKLGFTIHNARES